MTFLQMVFEFNIWSGLAGQGQGATSRLTIPQHIRRIDPGTILDTPCVLDSNGESVDR
jgi:hypothetical protein